MASGLLMRSSAHSAARRGESYVTSTSTTTFDSLGANSQPPNSALQLTRTAAKFPVSQLQRVRFAQLSAEPLAVKLYRGGDNCGCEVWLRSYFCASLFAT